MGDVGAGKSSLLYAVEMALFGVAEVDAAFLVRHGTSHAEVGVTLGDGEHTYAVRRRFRKVRRRGRETYEPERLTYAEDGHPASYSATEIRQRVIDLLGFPDNPNPHAHSDLWRWAIYVPQERMRDILAADPEERLETVRKALGVERYRTAADNAQGLAADLKLGARRRREEAGRMAHWDLELAEVTREGDRLRVERTALAATVGRAEASLDTARSHRLAGEVDLARVEADRRERESLLREASADDRASEEAVHRRDEASRDLEAARREAESLRPATSERDRLRTARASAENRLRARREELEGHAREREELAGAVERSDALSRRASEFANRARTAEAARSDTARALAEELARGPTREPPAPTPRTVGDLEREVAAAVAQEHVALDLLARARAALGQLDELLAAGVCPTCHQPVRSEEFSAHRSEAAGSVEAAQGQKDDTTARRERLEEERRARERYDRAHERWVDQERRRGEADQALARQDEELAAARRLALEAAREAEEAARARERLRPGEAERERLRKEVEAAETAVRDLVATEERAARAVERLGVVEALIGRLAAERARLEADLMNLGERRNARSGRIRQLESSLTGAAGVAEAVARAREAERNAERELADGKAALVRADTRLDALTERQTVAERGRAERATLVAEAADLEAKADWVAEPFRFAVLRMEKELLAHAQAAFDRAFSRFFASLIDDPTLIARTDVTFTPEVTIAGEATPAEALSGGERTGLALAFRLALARVVRSLGAVRLETLLLDEPTDGFSTEQVVRMGELLEELALPQVVVVSHEGELAGIADRTVRVAKVDGRSVLEVDALPSAAPAEVARPEGEPVEGPRPARHAKPRTS